ncbi:hypothetical protein [Candidatus Mycoplasma haematohominis]|uniref:hypothetical protein n=1 Tax=Candidatus Mycoplasma haematohominis TaxID=1494318 RepID=UPI001C0A70E3|nr:hypothetical protein [Candidatus Mycoplasma haemohominis]
MSVKAAAGTGAVVLTAVGGYGFSTFSASGEPDWKPFTANNLVGKYSEKTKAYFVGENSDAWWDWSYKNRWSKDKNENRALHHNFISVTSGKDLKDKCVAVYGEEKENVTSAYQNGKYLELEVWRYCSPLDTKPKTIQETGERTYEGSVSSYGWVKKEKFVSVTIEENNLFWELRDQEFFGLGNYSTILTDNSFDQSKDSLFHNFFKNKSFENRPKIKDVCGDAYKMTDTQEAEDKKVQVNTIIKFCSLEGN